MTSKSLYGGDRIRAKLWMSCRIQMAAGVEGRRHPGIGKYMEMGKSEGSSV